MVKLGLTGIILHDGLEDEFILKYQTDKIRFRLCVLGKFGIFEERWFLYRYIAHELKDLKMVFFTDSNDVYINSNPFHFAKIHTNYTLFIGRDNANRIKDSGWLMEEMHAFSCETGIKIPATFTYQWLYNAGVVGGDANVMRFFTDQFMALCKDIKTDYHKDMTIVNLIVHLFFYPKLSLRKWDRKLTDVKDDSVSTSKFIVTGFPFNSGFKSYEFNSKACFIHK